MGVIFGLECGMKVGVVLLAGEDGGGVMNEAVEFKFRLFVCGV